MGSTEFTKGLAKMMAEKNLTINELARKSGVHHVMIRGYLKQSATGKLPSLKTLLALAKALHCTVEDLTGTERHSAKADQKRHLANKLTQLLDESRSTQVELAKFSGCGQGLVAEHIRQTAFPRLPLLLKYSEFFTRKCGRFVSLYELTGLEYLKEIEDRARKLDPTKLDDKTRKFAELYKSLPESSPLRAAVEQILLTTITTESDNSE